MRFGRNRLIAYGILLAAFSLFLWWKWGSDPRGVFLKEVDGMIEQANQGQHLALRKKLSPEAESYISGNYMSVQQALFTARKLDTDGNYRYRFTNLNVFYPKDYAEIEVERSGPGGDFSDPRRFPVPFIYRKGEWLVAGGFRGERDFSNPFD